MTDPNVCNHPKCSPAYNDEEAKKMSSAEIRRTYPRFDGKCPDCNVEVIVYASLEHYLRGGY